MTSWRRLWLAPLLGLALTGSPALAQSGGGTFVWGGKLTETSKSLESTSAQDRVAAINEMRNFPPHLVVPLILEALDDDVDTVRLAAIRALQVLGAREATPRIIPLLEDRRVDIRVASAEALGDLGDRDAIDPLLAALSDRDSDVRGAAIVSLGKLRDPDTIPTLTGMLSDDAPAVVVTTLEVLSTFGDQTTVYAVLDKIRDPSRKISRAAVAALGELRDPRATMALLRLVQQNNTEAMREEAIAAIRKIRDPEAVESLHVLLDPNDTRLMWRIISALGEIGDSRSVLPLLRMLHHGDYEPAVSQAIVDIGEPAVPILIDELSITENTHYQRQLLAILAEIPSDTSALFLVRALENNQYPRKIMVQAAARVRDPRMLEVLVLVLPELDERELIGVLDRLGAHADDRLVRPLMELYPGASTELRKRILSMFATIGHTDALPIVREELRSDDLELLLRAIYAAQTLGSTASLDGLAKLLDADHPRVRHDAALAMGAIGGSRAIDLLLDVAQDDDHASRILATWALSLAVRGHDAGKAERFAFDVLEEPGHILVYPALDILGTSKPRGHHATLEKVYRGGRIGVRRKVLEVVGFIGDPAAAGIVALGLESDDPSIRAEAAWASGQLGLTQFEDRLVALIRDPSRQVEINAISSLGHLKLSSGIEDLQSVLWDRDPYLQASAVWTLRKLQALPEGLELELLLTRASNPFLKEQLYHALLDTDPDRLANLLPRERNTAIRQRIERARDGIEDPRAFDDWLLFDLEPEMTAQQQTHRPAIGERIYVMLPTGRIKASFSDENGKLRLELDTPGEVLQAYGRARYKGNLFGIQTDP